MVARATKHLRSRVAATGSKKNIKSKLKSNARHLTINFCQQEMH
jgi:hypothetical protein